MRKRDDRLLSCPMREEGKRLLPRVLRTRRPIEKRREKGGGTYNIIICMSKHNHSKQQHKKKALHAC